MYVWVKECCGVRDCCLHLLSRKSECKVYESGMGGDSAVQLAEKNQAALNLENSKPDRSDLFDPLLADMVNRTEKLLLDHSSSDVWVKECYGVRDSCLHLLSQKSEGKICEFVMGGASAELLAEENQAALSCSENSSLDLLDPLLADMANRTEKHEETVWFDPIIVNEQRGGSWSCRMGTIIYLNSLFFNAMLSLRGASNLETSGQTTQNYPATCVLSEAFSTCFTKLPGSLRNVEHCKVVRYFIQ